MMSFDIPSAPDLFSDVGRIELSHAIETLLGNNDKENHDGLLTQHVDSPAYLESSSINKTPHDGTLDRSSARQHCRRLESNDTTPRKRRESRRHLNSVNILCRSKRRKLAERQTTAATGLGMGFDSQGGFRHLNTLRDSNSDMFGRNSIASDPGVMVRDSSGKLHAAEFVPVMVEEQVGGYFMSGSGEGIGHQEDTVSSGVAQDESLTNITWLKRMSAPDMDSADPAQLQLPDEDCERPPYSYSALIQFALISTNVGKMTLKEIYDWIMANFPFFKTAKLGWKNSIRHNLSLHKIFIREPPDGPGKPAYWTLRPGTVVRLPENRLFIMDGVNSERARSRRPKACIKQSDGTTQLISDNPIPAPQKPKPILPRIPPHYTLLTTMPMVSGLSSDHTVEPRQTQKGRYARIAPKQIPGDPPVAWYLPSTSTEALPDPGINICNFKTPERGASRSRAGPSTESDPDVSGQDLQAVKSESRESLPVMSTPLKQLTTPSRLMESMGLLTPFRDEDDEFTLLRRDNDLSNITPIKGSGMTPIIQEFLSNPGDLQMTPVRRLNRPEDRSSVSTPVVAAQQDLSFDLDDLFGTELNAASTSDSSPHHFSFSQLFSPVARK